MIRAVLFMAAALIAAPAIAQADRALTAAEDARAAAEAARAAERRALRLTEGEAWLAAGRPARAVTALEDGAASGPADDASAGGVSCALGQALHMAGQPAAAAFRRCAALADAHDDARLAALAANGAGLIARSQRRTAEAAQHFARAAAAADRSADRLLQAQTRVNHALSLTRAGDGGGAAAALTEAADRLAGRSADVGGLIALNAIGRAWIDLIARGAAPDGAAQAAWRALSDAQAGGAQIGAQAALSETLGLTARLYELRGRPAEALRLLERAIFAADQAHATHLLWRWRWARGRLLEATGRGDEAVRAYAGASDALESIRTGLTAHLGANGASLREEAGALFTAQADLLTRQARAAGDAAPMLEQARRAIERFKRAEILEYFEDRCVIEERARAIPVDGIAPRAAVIYPIILSDRVESIVSLPGAPLRQYTTAIAEAELTALIRQFRQLLEKRTTHQYRKPAAALYDLLIRPIAADLDQAGVDTLVIAPDGPLRTIPYAALLDGREFLIDRFAVAVTPGLDLIDPQPIDNESLDILLAGVSDPVQGFPALPNVANELDNIASALGAEPLLNADFSASDLADRLARRNYDIVHIASHGVFEPQVGDSFILTHDGRISLDDLERFLRPARFRDQPVELLTLSACQTAAGDDRAALGLAGLGVKAGARAALASLWFINDEASSDLISRFYDQLRYAGVSKAQALRRAQLGVKGERRFRHAYYWSAFLMIGNWR